MSRGLPDILTAIAEKNPRRAASLVFTGVAIVLAAVVGISVLTGASGGASMESSEWTHRGVLIGSVALLGCLAAWKLIDSLLKKQEEQMRALAAAAFQISGGNLSVTAPDSEYGPARDLALFMNELSANVQEILLTLWKQNIRCKELLLAAEKNLAGPDGDIPVAELLEHLAAMRGCLNQNQDMIGAFAYFDVRFEEDDRLSADAKTDPA